MPFDKFLGNREKAAAAVGKGPVWLRRDDGPDLVVRQAELDAADRDGLRLAVAMLDRLLAHANRKVKADALREVFSWMSFLPERDRIEFAREMTNLLGARGVMYDPGRILTLVAQWQNTTEAWWAEPDLRERLGSETDAHGEVVPTVETAAAGHDGTAASSPVPGEWTVRFGNRMAAEAWTAALNSDETEPALAHLHGLVTGDPRSAHSPEQHHRLKGSLGTWSDNGVEMEQWQHQISRGGWIWFRIDDADRTVWIMEVSPEYLSRSDWPERI